MFDDDGMRRRFDTRNGVSGDRHMRLLLRRWVYPLFLLLLFFFLFRYNDRSRKDIIHKRDDILS